VQFEINTLSGGNQYFDVPFDTAFIGTYETARPFTGSPSAPVNAVGIYAGDECALSSAISASPIACGIPANQLISFNAANATGSVANVTPSQVRFIANGQTADSIYGTPFGNVARNSARDYQTNTANFAITKDTQVTERVKAQFRMDLVNVFNHPNFLSVDPFIDDAGLTSFETGFGTPSLFDGGPRTITFEVKVFF